MVDGELSHDRRDRVLAHLATCASCKAEADDQRRVKSVFAKSALPPPPKDLLARLQGLPTMVGEHAPPPPAPPSPPAPPAPHLPAASSSPPPRAPLGGGALGDEREYRIHGPGAAARLHRGHRFAFAAAGAVSLAAFAIGGAVGTAGGGASAPSASGGASASGTGTTQAVAVRSTGTRTNEEERQGSGGRASRSATPLLSATARTSPTGALAPSAQDDSAAQLFSLSPLLTAGLG